MRMILCPFCFKKFRAGRWLFRCVSDNPAACPKEGDRKLAAFRRAPQPIPENRVFRSPSELWWLRPPRRAQCPKCSQETFKLVCPECHNTLPSDIGQLSSYTFGLIGARESGKSQYVGVLINALRHELGDRLNWSLSHLNDETAQRYREEFHDPLFEGGRVVAATTTARIDYRHMTPLLYCLTQERNGRLRRGLRALSLTFFDTAGEDLLNEDVMETTVRYLVHSNGLVLLVDPLQIDSVRRRIQDESILPVEKADPLELVGRIGNVIRKHLGLRRGKRIRIPLAIAFSKCDALEGILHPGSIVLRRADHGGTFDLDDFAQLHAELEGQLEEWLGGGFNQLVRQNFEHYGYFGLSALGSAPESGGRLARPVNPHRIEDPLLWLMWRNKLIAGRKGGA